MAESTIWWVLAGGAIAVELLTGTFYLLMLSLGLIAAALAAHAGAAMTTQLVVAALVGGGFIIGWRARRLRAPAELPAGANQDANLDVGETVQVDSWLADGTSTVKYRGANWSVALVAGASPTPGAHRIVEVVGSRLVVRKV